MTATSLTSNTALSVQVKNIAALLLPRCSNRMVEALPGRRGCLKRYFVHNTTRKSTSTTGTTTAIHGCRGISTTTGTGYSLPNSSASADESAAAAAAAAAAAKSQLRQQQYQKQFPLTYAHVCGPTHEPLLDKTLPECFADTVSAYGDNLALVSPHQQEQLLLASSNVHTGSGNRSSAVAPHGDGGIGGSSRYTYSELDSLVESAALGMRELGLVPGDRLGIWAPNCTEWVVTMHAAARAGLILVNVNPAYRAEELTYALNKVGCRALVTARGVRHNSFIETLETLLPELHDLPMGVSGGLKADALPHLEHIIALDDDLGLLTGDDMSTISRFSPSPAAAAAAAASLAAVERPGIMSFRTMLLEQQQQSCGNNSSRSRAELSAVTRSLNPYDDVNIQFTSGTTGAPKGATLTHHNIVNNAYFCAQTLAYTHSDRVCVPVPLYHCFGTVIGTLACTTVGATVVLPSAVFDPRATLDAVERERCTALYGVPTMFIAQLELEGFSHYNLSSLRTGVMAGSACPVELMHRVGREMHMPELTVCYGQTETSPVSFQSHRSDGVETRCATVGRIHPHVEAKVVDPETEETLKVGERGELYTRGYIVMARYWDDQERTRDSFSFAQELEEEEEETEEEGKGLKQGKNADYIQQKRRRPWMRTGDMATIDEEGLCRIVGRYKDLVIRGGENIYPLEIENLLYKMPKVADVQVVGVPDERYGEELCACIVPREGEHVPTQAQVAEFMRGKISHFKIPKYVLGCDEYPLTITGKIQKFRLRQQVMERLDVPAE